MLTYLILTHRNLKTAIWKLKIGYLVSTDKFFVSAHAYAKSNSGTVINNFSYPIVRFHRYSSSFKSTRIKFYIFCYMEEDTVSLLLSIVSQCSSVAGWIFLRNQIHQMDSVLQACNIWMDCLEISDDKVFINLVGLLLSERNNQLVPKLVKNNDSFSLQGTAMPNTIVQLDGSTSTTNVSFNQFFNELYSRLNSPNVFLNNVFNALIDILCGLPYFALLDTNHSYTWGSSKFSPLSVYDLLLEKACDVKFMPIITELPCFFPSGISNLNDPVPSIAVPDASVPLTPANQRQTLEQMLSLANNIFGNDPQSAPLANGGVKPNSIRNLFEKTILGALLRFGMFSDLNNNNLFKSLVSSLRSLPSPPDFPIPDPDLQDIRDPLSSIGPKHYLGHLYAAKYESVNSLKNLFRQSVFNLQINRVHGYLLSCIKLNPTNKSNILLFFTIFLHYNSNRIKSEINDFSSVCGDNFNMNITWILLQFSNPFLDAQCSKLSKIDPKWLISNNHLIHDETRLHMTSDELSTFLNNQPPTTPSTNTYNPFISTIFHNALLSLHVGFMPIVRSFIKENKQLANLNLPDNPMFMQHAVNTMESLISHKLSFEAGLMNLDLLSSVVLFYKLQAQFMISIASTLPIDPSDLPIPLPNPQLFHSLPEWFIEDLLDFHHFILVYHIKCNIEYPSLLVFLLFIIKNHALLVKNPYLKSKIIEILYLMTMIKSNDNTHIIDQVLTIPFVVTHLLPSLVIFYSFVESTGASSQFYDKFNIRYHAQKVIQHAYTYSQHKQVFVSFSKDPEFIKFVNLLMNDTTYLLDEGFSKLKAIHELELLTELSKEQEQQMVQNQRHATSLISLANETTLTLSLLSMDIKEVLSSREIVDRLAAMINYNLELLVGPKCAELKVKDAMKYQFEPKILVGRLVDVCYNLMDMDGFIIGMANDYRSFKLQTFRKVSGVLIKTGIKRMEVVEGLEKMTAVVMEKQKEMEADNEEEDAPEAFMDGLMYFVMRDPVILPSSKNVVDRSTITTHLLSDGHDPFNRQPLKIGEVVAHTELRKQIEAWRKERKIKK